MAMATQRNKGGVLMAVLDKTYFIGDTSIWLVDEDPQTVPVDPASCSGDLIYYQVVEGAPLTLYVKTSNGNTADAQRLIVRNMTDATAPPTVSDGLMVGFGLFSKWLDTTGNDVYTCVDPTPFAAVWKKITP